MALQSVARIIERNVRASDIVYRYGGEESRCSCPARASTRPARPASGCGGAIENAGIAGGQSQPGGRLTISVGISTLEAGRAEGLKSRADDALYRAKAAGRNQSVVA